MLGLLVVLVLIAPCVWVVRYAMSQSLLDQVEKRDRLTALSAPEARSPATPSRSQKGDPGGYSWPWELTTSDGPDDDHA